MSLAPLIHRSRVQIQLWFDSRILRDKPPSPVAVRFASSSSIRYTVLFTTSDGGRYCYCTRLDRMSCFKGRNPEDLELTEELQISDSQLHDEENKNKKAASDTYLGLHSTLIKRQSSVRVVALCVLSALAFGGFLGWKDGLGKASEFFAGYILEQSLSVDNLFVFVLIFKYFKVPAEYQSQVLSYGIAGAITFRAIIILLGTVTIQRLEAVNLVLALILLFSSYKLFSGEEEDTDLADNLIVKACQKFIPVTAHYNGNQFITMEDSVWKATPLLLTVAVIELSDIAFAIDSIPAVFGVTRDPFIVFSSNLFAISGLRSLYALVSQSMSDLEYLQPAIGIVLGFIGTKMIFDFFGYHISTEVSLGFVATSITTAILLSLRKKSNSEDI